ncbi:MAG: protein NosL [Deltaproteobacteria bacterium]|jgi:copper chaperone NosL|nr:protein NosL [Deltaproteobacteria bacterium]MBT4263318.1 protein NosL [Deltaproteobacteria bacterium]MBT4641550.1 protein NosL [Deltaproteobacteria bacterium]MBT6504682.1 protein NosL [Deltaproteobacteria bacterium]MBT6611329.1 protein NosL [Deltaproteobacteria bacterium]
MNKLLILLFAGLLLLTSCKKGNKEQLPVDFVWDRVVCEECKMALSDPNYSAQVIDPDGKPHYFDDIGCAILWLRRQPWRKKSRTWVNDVNTKKWIDAEKANWVYGDTKTPMGYGFAATLKPVKNPMPFKMVKKWMYIGKTLVRENTAKHLGLKHQSPVTVGPAVDRSKLGKTSKNR